MSTISMNCRRAASFAGTQCLSRLRRTHGVFSRLRRSLRKQAVRSLLSAPYGKALQRQAKIFIQAKITVPPHVRNRRIKHSKSLTLGIPRVRDLLFIRKKTSLFFRCLVHDYAIVTVQWTHSVFSRLRRSLRKQTARSLLSAPQGKALQRQAKIFIQAKITVPPHVRNRRIKYRRPPTLGIPGGGGLTVIGKKPSLSF